MDLKFLLFGFFVHIIFFYSLFDIYFTSPLTHGMNSHKNSFAPPAKRIILFSADGLRADHVFDISSGMLNTPFLRNIIENVGIHGISHTRVPTESRPGHVAFIAGFYEDVSAVTKGWKENPVEFDSIFNQSTHTWSWGSPDILPMFSKEKILGSIAFWFRQGLLYQKHAIIDDSDNIGASANRVFTEMYPDHSEDFAGTDLTKLDSWVFDSVQYFFNMSKQNDSSLLHENGLIFFLHLLGLDTTGHIHKPYSQEYMRNLKVVDEGIKRIIDIVEDYYDNDGLTSFIFTSDHGMTNWGSHGAGDPSETQTPFIAWGAGINHPTFIDGDKTQKSLDINQADICPLMATLIGIPIPGQSVGVIPVNVLNTSMSFKAQSLYTNLLQVHEQYKIKANEKQETVFSSFFVPYKADYQLKDGITSVENLIKDENYQDAINESISLISLTREGMHYYHQYDVNFLGICMAMSFLGWVMMVVAVLVEDHSNIPLSPLQPGGLWQCRIDVTLKLVGGFMPFMVLVFLAAQSKPVMYYLYCLLPIVIFNTLLRRRRVLEATCMQFWRHGMKKETFIFIAFMGLSLEVAIFSFTHRYMISVGLIAMGMWKLLDHSGAWTGWTISCLAVSVFPLLPTVGLASNYLLVYSSAILGFTTFAFFALRIYKSSIGSHERKKELLLHALQALVVLASGFILWWFVTHRKSSQSPSQLPSSMPSYLHSMSWMILASSFVVPLLSSTKMLQRLLSILLANFSPYLLLSISHESFFYLNLCALMIFWIQLETGLSFKQLLDVDFKKHKLIQRKLQLSDVRCSYFFIFFLLTSFFGTGNIASINSFDPTSVLCFVTVFNPYVMGGLMLFKIIILFLIVSSCFYSIQVAMNVPKNGFFLLILAISDFMALHFFFMVKNHGSWLEIGVSISHYVIVMTLILLLFLLLSISKLITETTLFIRAYDKWRTE